MRREPPHPTIWKRAIVIWLALLQVVAPTWHVCGLGGSTHRHADEGQAKVWTPKCGGGPICPCVPPAGATVSSTGQDLSASDKEHSHGTCLARLLMGMPGSLSASFNIVILNAQSTTFAPSLCPSPAVALMPQPPARGPPVASV